MPSRNVFDEVPSSLPVIIPYSFLLSIIAPSSWLNIQLVPIPEPVESSDQRNFEAPLKKLEKYRI